MPSELVIAMSDWCATVTSTPAACSSRKTASVEPATFVTNRLMFDGSSLRPERCALKSRTRLLESSVALPEPDWKRSFTTCTESTA